MFLSISDGHCSIWIATKHTSHLLCTLPWLPRLPSIELLNPKLLILNKAKIHRGGGKVAMEKPHEGGMDECLFVFRFFFFLYVSN